MYTPSKETQATYQKQDSPPAWPQEAYRPARNSQGSQFLAPPVVAYL